MSWLFGMRVKHLSLVCFGVSLFSLSDVAHATLAALLYLILSSMYAADLSINVFSMIMILNMKNSGVYVGEDPA
jgi:hypothetical protein